MSNFARFSDLFSLSLFSSGILLILSVPDKLVSLAEELSRSWTQQSLVSMLHTPNPPGWWTGSSTGDQTSFNDHNDLDHTPTEKTSYGPRPMPGSESRDHPVRSGFQNSDSNRTSSGSITEPSMVWNSSAISGNPVIKALSISKRSGSRINQSGMVSRKQKISTEPDSDDAPAVEGLQRTKYSQQRSMNAFEQEISTGTDHIQKMSVEQPTNPSYSYSSMMSSWLSIPAMALKKSLRQHAHSITLRDAENATLNANMPALTSESQPAGPPTYFPHETTNVTVPSVTASVSVNSSSAKTISGTNMPANVTSDAFSSQSSETDTVTGSIHGSLSTSLNIPQLINDSSTSELLSRTNVSRMPSTPRGHGASGNQSGPDVNTAESRATICLTKMDIVWVVLAITVPVSSCCEYLAL